MKNKLKLGKVNMYVDFYEPFTFQGVHKKWDISYVK